MWDNQPITIRNKPYKNPLSSDLMTSYLPELTKSLGPKPQLIYPKMSLFHSRRVWLRVGMIWVEPNVIPVVLSSILVVPGPPNSGSETSLLLARPLLFNCCCIRIAPFEPKRPMWYPPNWAQPCNSTQVHSGA
jgi:hypothetical protein